LERVLAVVIVSQNRPANAQNHRAMPLDEHRERHLGRLAAVSDENTQ
jgi:hypothetical protein